MLGYPDCATLVRIRIVSNPFQKGRSAHPLRSPTPRDIL
jgi:hypothetical protein